MLQIPPTDGLVSSAEQSPLFRHCFCLMTKRCFLLINKACAFQLSCGKSGGLSPQLMNRCKCKVTLASDDYLYSNQ